jgi:hypothetical protein
MFSRRFLTGTALAGAAFPPGFTGLCSEPTGFEISSLEVVNFAMVIGAISAAMISAIWLIRERAKIDAENTTCVPPLQMPTHNCHVISR